MQVRNAMSTQVLSIGPDHTLRQAARLMSQKRVGAAVVVDPDSSGIGILTERDILNAIGAGLDPDVERTGSHLTSDLVFAPPTWTLHEAASAMVRGGFRHLIIIDGKEPSGVISVRDIVRVWSQAIQSQGAVTTPMR